ncbi:MAG: DUF389 domain-containing protein [Candidatus Woykebacteria bacterium]
MFLSIGRRDSGNVLKVDKSEQYHTVDELISKSQPNSIYYTLLILSAVIISAGLLLGNNPIVIGGMLVTPVMTPVLLFALGLSIVESKAIRKAGFLMVISFLVVLLISWILAQAVGVGQLKFLLEGDPTRIFVLYSFVALSSGIAATLAWAHKDLTDVLPGIAIAVSLTPPLSLVGISLSSGDQRLINFYLLVFIFNLAGMTLGSLITYILLKFYKARREVERTIEAKK